jgi:hypothetical protein
VLKERRLRAGADGGSAIVEFIFVAVLVLIPLVYLIVAVAVVQRSRLATTSASRDVGRAIGGANSPAQASRRAAAALRIAVANQGYSANDVTVKYVAADADCLTGAPQPLTLAPGGVFAVCVIRSQQLPAVPTIVGGRGIQTVGRYVVHLDEFRIVTH